MTPRDFDREVITSGLLFAAVVFLLWLASVIATPIP